MARRVVLAIDEGTTNSKAVLVTQAGEIIASGAAPVPIEYPRSGWVQQDAGAISLSFLTDMKTDEAMAYLLSLPGVGPKTASVVLLFAFSMPFLPVDTHVYRVSRRLGLLCEDVGPNKAQIILEMIVPVEKYISLHLNLITHGRLVCRARNPKHEECVLKSFCDYFLQGQKP